MREPIEPALRQAIIEAYHGICQYCERLAGEPHIDHIIPVARGGQTELGNLILACQRCNLRKKAGLISPRYIALITAIADERRPLVERILAGRPAGWRWVKWRNFAGDVTLVRISSRPSRGDVERLMAANERWGARCDLMRKRYRLMALVGRLLEITGWQKPATA